jgi:CRP/FNR family transcriptional regulator, cyclic AMP receptor protein
LRVLSVNDGRMKCEKTRANRLAWRAPMIVLRHHPRLSVQRQFNLVKTLGLANFRRPHRPALQDKFQANNQASMVRPLRSPAPSLSVAQLLQHSSWYAQVSPAAQAQVQKDISERAIAIGDSLGFQGEPQRSWFGVLEGLLKWSISAADGRTVTLGGQSVGSWFGEGTLIRSRPRNADLVALRHSRIALIPFETFDWLRRTEPAFSEFVLLQINERLHWFMGNYAAHRLLDTDRLVARALTGLIHPLLNPRGERYLMISQEELANLATVSRQRCNASLAAMKRDGLLQLDYGAVRVLDVQALQQLAE